ncbi:MFS transporter [Fodinicola feengrottensis]|uniref:MFS transporter n=1 Tax=Fodinicola feengrottensis TaxID=435914 RepID=A0ABN2IGF8_9ACTN
MASLRLDVTPLRGDRDFRILFAAGTVFYFGFMITYVALPFQLYHLTGSNFAVGALGLIELLPLIVCGLYGGALADHVDRRTMLVLTGVGQVLLTVGLLGNAMLPHPQVWIIYVLGALLAAVASLQRPSREALLPRVVSHAQLPAAVALSSFGVQLSMLVGPALGGIVIAQVGVPLAFGIDVAGLIAATALFAGLRRYPVTDGGQPPSVASIVDGIRYAVRRKDLLGTYLVDMVAMLMASPVVLFPAYASEVLKQPTVLGLLYSAGTVGGLLATATSGWTSRVHHHGRAVVLAAATWGAATAVAALTNSIWLVLVAFAVAGGADMMSGLFRSVIWNQTIPDSKRGRLAGIEVLSYSIGPLGGEARAGMMADLTGVRSAILSGGVLCCVGVGVTALWLRDFWRYDSRTDEHAIAQRELHTV